VVCLDLRKICSYCDYFIITSGNGRRHVGAIAEGILEDLRTYARPMGVEGMDAQRWVLLDYGDVVVHVFDPDMRGFYDLEGIWSDAPRVSV